MHDTTPNSTPNLQGHLLIADPSLRDSIFNKSVILLAEHESTKGASGLILNHPTDQKVGDLLTSPEFEPLKNIRVHLGGPLDQEHLTFAAFWKDHTNLKFATRISANDAIKRIQQPGTLVRAFAGHSGWTAGQLESELDQQSWITRIPDSALLSMQHEKSLWTKMMQKISAYHQILAEAPEDLFLN